MAPSSSHPARSSGERWQRFAGAVAARAPDAPDVLEPYLEEAVAAVLREHREAIAGVRGRVGLGVDGWGGGAPAGGRVGGGVAGEPFAGADALAALAEGLVREARARAWASAARGGRAARLAAALDARLPTEAVEWMDRDTLPAARRDALVASLDTWNRRFGNYVRFAEAVAPVLRPGDTVLDVAAGHGGFARTLARLAPAPGCRVIASDRAPVRRDDGITWWDLDARHLAAAVRPGEVDVITCTSALHHFGAGGVALLLAQALARARAVVFVDLARSVDRMVVAGAVARLGARDALLAHDTIVSFRRAFRPAELRLVAALVPGGEGLEVRAWAPGFVLVRGGA